VFRQNLIKRINLNTLVIYIITILLTAATLGLLIIPFEILMKFPDLSLMRRLGIPYSPTYGLVKALWCIFHGKLFLAVTYNRLVYLFFVVLMIQYLSLIRQCSSCRLLHQSKFSRYSNNQVI
jgi:Protein of unknown function (DUF2752)